MIRILRVCFYQLLISTLTLTSAQSTHFCYGNIYCNCNAEDINNKAYFCSEPSIKDMVILNVRYTANITHIEIESVKTFNQPDYHMLFANIDEWTSHPVNFTIQQSAVPAVPFIELFNIFSLKNTVRNLTFTKAKQLPDSTAPPVFRSNHLSKLYSVIVLNLSENNFEDLPEHLFADMVKLEQLFLNGNSLRKLPAKIFKSLKNLKVLNLSRNRLLLMNEKPFLKPDSGTEINLIDNDFEYVPEEVVMKVVLNKNHVRRMPAKIFTPLKNLTSLDLSENKLSSLDKYIFRDLISLENLNLNGNNISDLSYSLFKSQTHLKNLQLANNQLKNLTMGVFRKLKNLTTLNLSGNRLNDLTKPVFSSLTRLENLQLANNEISELKKGIFDDLKHLKTVDLFGNKVNPQPRTTSWTAKKCAYHEPEFRSWLWKLGSHLENAFKGAFGATETLTPRTYLLRGGVGHMRNILP
ncbi:toll-like receptor 3 [Planococcus citri]|uniref:toll-like receptor 3 n=1 Tax=Planococcus citri TaxID=170843 RepID=UPI0031F935BF